VNAEKLAKCLRRHLTKPELEHLSLAVMNDPMLSGLSGAIKELFVRESNQDPVLERLHDIASDYAEINEILEGELE
jgi:hypothetical protein